MVNIMVDAIPVLRPIGINKAMKINIENINWCIENSLTRDTEIYAMIFGQKTHLTEIVRLALIKPYDKSHAIYNIVPGLKIRINDEPVCIKLIILDKNQYTQRISNSISFVLLTNDYSLTRQTAIAQELGLVIQGYYKAIANMYNDLKKGDTTNDSQG